MNSVSVTIDYKALIDVADDGDVRLSPEKAKELLDMWDVELSRRMVNAAYDLMVRIIEDYKKEKELTREGGRSNGAR